MLYRSLERVRRDAKTAVLAAIIGELLWLGLKWLMRGLAEDRVFSGLNAWIDAHWSLNILLWACWMTLFIAAFLWATRLGARAAQTAPHGISAPRLNRLPKRLDLWKPPLRERISFLEFKEIAEQEYGWDFGPHSSQVLSLANGLRQAAIDDDVNLWGRRIGDMIPDAMRDNYPLRPIPKDHLMTWWLNPLTPRNDNFDIETYNFEPDYRRENFRDVHLGSEKAAKEWLRNKGSTFQTPQPNIEAEKALIHMAHHSALGDRMAAKSAFEQAARDGRLVVWGRQIVEPHGEAASDEIRRKFWEDAELDLATFILFERPRSRAADYDHSNVTTQRSMPLPNRSVPVYVALRVNKEQVVALWPTTRRGSPLK